MSVLVDTSCLLRLPNPIDPRRVQTQDALGQLTRRGETLAVAPQNFVEFRSVATRPINVNGLGLTNAEADAELDLMERSFLLLSEDGFYPVWRDLCRRAGVSGKLVHDTRLVVVCIAAGVKTVLTWNPADFIRFMPLVPGLIILTPADVLAVP